MMSERPATKSRSNRLAHEKSPYLLQHAVNPVDWYPWGLEAFAEAKKEDKPVFLSIGYSTCHWCRVMEKESFEDTEVANLMNAAFVSIKVDREERPDIDHLYMKVCQMLTGRGGRPLTIIMTPDKKPFFAGTYIPKTSRFNLVGMMDLIPRIQEMWKSRKQELIQSADKIIQALQEPAQEQETQTLGLSTLKSAYDQLILNFDHAYGGFRGAPKFPTPHNLFFLLRYWRRNGDSKALEMVERTLVAMRHGGIFDHVGLGFHRYSTDSEWLLPHFEKMLYDQALLAMAYTEVFQVTGKQAYRETAEEIFTYVLRDMTSPEGAFYSAEDRVLLDRFWDQERGGLFFTSSRSLFLRDKSLYDGAVPSANSVALFNLLRLSRLTADAELEARASVIGETFAAEVSRYPSAYTQFLCGIDFGHGPSFEVVIVGREDAADTRGMLEALGSAFLPGMVVLFVPHDDRLAEITKVAPFVADFSAKNGKSTAYVCQGHTCQQPTTKIKQMLESLGLRSKEITR